MTDGTQLFCTGCGRPLRSRVVRDAVHFAPCDGCGHLDARSAQASPHDPNDPEEALDINVPVLTDAEMEAAENELAKKRLWKRLGL